MANDAAALFESLPVMMYTALLFDIGRQMFPDKPYTALTDQETIQARLKLSELLFVSRQTLANPVAAGIVSASTPETDSGHDPKRPSPYL